MTTPPAYTVGVDLGQAGDYTALVILEQHAAGLHLRYLYRFPLQTPYPRMVAAIVALLAQAPLDGKATLVVDHTGVGRPVVDMFRDAGLSPIAVTLTGGDAVSNDGLLYRVPKRDMVHALVRAFQCDELKIASRLELAPALTKELANFKMKISVSGHDTYEAWRENAHDDLVLAAALPVWWLTAQNDVSSFLAAMRQARPVRPRVPLHPDAGAPGMPGDLGTGATIRRLGAS